MNANEYRPTERRPIASRELRWSRAMAQWLVRGGVSANFISVMGTAVSLLAGVAFSSTSWAPAWARIAWLVGAVLVQMRLLANMFDGMVAIESGKASRLGELYNEIPDRFSDAATFIGWGYAAGSAPALGYLAACIAILTAYVRAMAKVAGAPQDYCGPMAKPHRIFLITVAAVYLAMAPASWTVQCGSWGVPAFAALAIVIGGSITVLRRLLHAAAALGN